MAETPETQQAQGRNLAGLISRRRRVLRVLGASASGVLLTLAFAPVEWTFLAWVGLLPLLWTPMPATKRQQALLGYLFGYVHWATMLLWLNEVGFGAGYLLALVCGIFPMAWYLVVCALTTRLLRSTRAAREERRPAALRGGRAQCAFVFAAACTWVTLEWVRGWIFTGFPWNQLGVSQWLHVGMVQICAWTGVYGVSFLVVCFNLALGFALAGWWFRWRHGVATGISWPLALVAVLFVPVFLAARKPAARGEPSGVLRVLGVQGNIPMCREWTREEFDEALAVYLSLTREFVPRVQPDLVVWPESAVPAPIGYRPFSQALDSLLDDLDCHLLIGALDSRPLPNARWTETGWEPPLQEFNSAILYAPDNTLTDYYDKIHRVPFGEYTPFARYLPWLERWIGMGRGLTAGTEYTVFHLPHGARAGVNICFEDAFPEISREFARRGANLLMTLTNDAWYAESAGARQHLSHAVFRAIECGLPLFRSGNNSDTCLILPDGRVTDLLRHPETGYPFVRGARGYDVPLWEAPIPTFYTRHGDVFVYACCMGACLALVCLAALTLRDRRALLKTISNDIHPEQAARRDG